MKMNKMTNKKVNIYPAKTVTIFNKKKIATALLRRIMMKRKTVTRTDVAFN